MGEKIKFQFIPEFQFDILRFCALDRNGSKVIPLLEDHYFSDIDHAFIFYGIKSYIKTNKRIPSKVALKQELSELFSSKDFYDKLTAKDETRILQLSDSIWNGPLRDGDNIFKKIERFIQYIELKRTLEDVDIEDFSQYDQFSMKVQKAISKKIEAEKHKGSLLIRDVKDRQVRRQEQSPVYPLPYRQLNLLTNAGGLPKNSIVVLLDQPKKFKTGALMNIAIGYMKMKLKVLVIDLENGEDSLMVRVEQSLLNADKKTVLSGEVDNKLQKLLRKYKRLGAELAIHRLPAYSTTCNDISKIMDMHYKEDGLSFDMLILDYAAKLGTSDRRDDDTSRIDRAYVELQNLCLEKDIIHAWTAHHVVRSAAKRSKTRYLGNDVAKAVDITRHVEAIYGLNRSQDEEEQGFLRMEVVEQRDGKKGRAVFAVNQDTQRMIELTSSQRKQFDEIFVKIEEKINSEDGAQDDSPQAGFQANRRKDL